MFTLVKLICGVYRRVNYYDDRQEAIQAFGDLVASDPTCIAYLFNDEAESTSAVVVATTDWKVLFRARAGS